MKHMSWLLLILTLPTENSTARMRAWRALKSSGAAVLRDGVYVLPEAHGAGLQAIAEDVSQSGGQAWLLQSEAAGYDFRGLFDRTGEYEQLTQEISAAMAASGSEQARLVRKLRKGYGALVDIDFFPGEAQRQVAARLADLERLASGPDEPVATRGVVPRHDQAEYQGRLWATRQRPWVDRLASAWLISRFIDREARFLWLASPADCPSDALGFDFDGATFTHVGEFVSFETLLHAFGLAQDAGLERLARIVHYLDAGGLPAPEAAGLETLLAGMRAAITDDDALLAAASTAFDFFYSTLKEHT
jgi:hypothetical protein